MKRLLALILIAFAFTIASLAPMAQAIAAPVGDPGAGKPEAAMDNAMKDSKDTADADKNAKKEKKVKKHHKGKKHHHKKAEEKTEDTKKDDGANK